MSKCLLPRRGELKSSSVRRSLPFAEELPRGTMINAYDIAYGLGVGLASPFWLAKPSARRKVLGAFRQRMGNVTSRDLTHPAVLLHAVSLGEVNATPALVQLLRQR